MLTQLSPDQEQFIQTKLQAGKYHSAHEILAMAFRLLDEYDRSDSEWIADAQLKIDQAIEASKHTSAIDGETFVNQMLERLHHAKQAS